MVDTRFHHFSGSISLINLLNLIADDELVVKGEITKINISGVNTLNDAKNDEITLVGEKKYLSELKETQSKIIIVSKDLADEVKENSIILITKDPALLFVKILNILYPNKSQNPAQVKKTFKLEDGVLIGENVYIGENVQIGKGTKIASNAVIGNGVCIGRNCIIGANCSVEYAFLGDDVVMHAGARIGTEGFGWLSLGNENIKVPQLGRVIIQDKVEIGANSTIDRGALGDTTIGENTKIDNLVQVGHNCQIGRNCLIAAMSGISGSTIIEDSVLFGGGAGTAGHLTIGAGSYIHGRAAVTKDWPKGSKLAGAPAQDIKEFWKEIAAMRRLTRGNKK